MVKPKRAAAVAARLPQTSAEFGKAIDGRMIIIDNDADAEADAEAAENPKPKRGFEDGDKKEDPRGYKQLKRRRIGESKEHVQFSGKEYKPKKGAAGDALKPGKLEPFRYMKLDRRLLDNRGKKHRAVAGLNQLMVQQIISISIFSILNRHCVMFLL